jgi:hypothetical protein
VAERRHWLRQVHDAGLLRCEEGLGNDGITPSLLIWAKVPEVFGEVCVAKLLPQEAMAMAKDIEHWATERRPR